VDVGRWGVLDLGLPSRFLVGLGSSKRIGMGCEKDRRKKQVAEGVDENGHRVILALVGCRRGKSDG